MAKPKPSSLSPAQLQIMNIVWRRGEVGIAEIWQELSRSRPVARNTVQTMVTRLAAKGWLKHRAQGNAFVYTAQQPKQRAVGSLVSRLVDSAFGGSAGALVLTLLENAKLSKGEADQIRELIDRAESSSNRARKS